jgi:3-oxoacyl-ACP reductase-like protein
MKNKLLLSFAVLLLSISWSVAQSPQAAPAQSPAAQQSPSPAPSPSASPATPHNRVEIEEEPEEKDHKLTPAEAQELLQSVDEVLHFVSKDTLLPIKHDVKKRIVSRDQVEKFITERFKDDVDRIRFERSELVLK